MAQGKKPAPAHAHFQSCPCQSHPDPFRHVVVRTAARPLRGASTQPPRSQHTIMHSEACVDS
eukprot:749555-Alexandrium_andersonii.AAC.1